MSISRFGFALFLLALQPIGSAGAVTPPSSALDGQLLPAAHTTKAPVRCADDMNKLAALLSTWKQRMTKIAKAQRDVGRTTNQLGTLYSTTSADGQPKAVPYLQDLTTSINNLSGYMDNIVSEITTAQGCMWSDQYKIFNGLTFSGCYAIPLSCVDEPGLNYEITQSQKSVKALHDNLQTNEAELVGELPADFVYKNIPLKVWWERPLDSHPPCSIGSPTCTYTICSAQQVLCQQHLTLSIDTLIKVQDAINQLY